MWRTLSATVGLVGLTLNAAAAAAEPPQREIFDKYCVTCHNEKLKTAGLMLDNIDVSQVAANAAVLEKVTHKLRAGQMPPAGRPRPDKATLEAFADALETELDRAAAAAPNPGRLAVHRLNRLEYVNAIHDLLALDIDPALLPADNPGIGFDNNADVLSVTPVLMNRYISAATKVSRLAMADPTIRPSIQVYRASEWATQTVRMSEDLPFGTHGGLAIRHAFPLDGEYTFKLRLQRNFFGGTIRGIDDEHEIEVRIDDALIKRFKVGGKYKGADPGILIAIPEDEIEAQKLHSYHLDADKDLHFRLAVKAGPRFVAAAFTDSAPSVLEMVPLRPRSLKNSNFDDASAPGIDSIEISGPYEASAPEDTPSRRQIFVCRPTSGSTERSGAGPPSGAALSRRPSASSGRAEPVEARERDARSAASGGGAPRVLSNEGTPRLDDDACARKILSTLARRAYRRPVTDVDLRELMGLYTLGRQEGALRQAQGVVSQSNHDFDAGIQLALEMMLSSPAFLFRMEHDPAGAKPGMVYRLSDLELASRLSFFLWRSVPDDELLDVAATGRLKDPTVLEQQVRRMLSDPKATRWMDDFIGQWLMVRNLQAQEPDPSIFPEFEDNLREAMKQETELFFESQVREDQSLLDLLRADYTYVNERLARHYGVSNVYGSHFRRVPVTDPARQGLLGHASVLTVTSYADRTSVVLRGKWVLENLLGAPPPPPPPNVPPLPQRDARKPTSLRERMEQHRNNPVCASCHAPMDPMGFTLENFDATGRWRDDDSGAAIDAAVTLADGTKIDSPTAYRAFLLNERRGELVRTVAEKLLTYALGRGVEYYDAPTVRQVVRDAATADYRWSSLILSIVKSTPFQMRRVAPAQGTVGQ